MTLNSTYFVQMKSVLQRWCHFAEIDRAVFFGVLARGWQMLAGVVSLLLIAHYLSPQTQGFYYTFGSLMALQGFVELGFYVVIINFASHEWAQLGLTSGGRIEGKPEALSRLISLGRLIFKWYAVGSALFIVAVGTGGYIFFSQKAYEGISWVGPWITLTILTGLLLWASPFNSLLEGCNQVATIQKFRLNQAILSSLGLWLILLWGGGLWAVVASVAISLARDVYLIGVQYRRFFAPFLAPPSGLLIRWTTDIWPMQWRLAISAVFGYFAFYLYTPVMFHYHGAAIAGQMGMTWTIISTLQGLALMWVYPKVPRFGILVANKDYIALDRFWLRTSVASLIVVSGCGVAFWFVVYSLNVLNIPLAQRMLPPLATGIFLVAAFFNQISQCQSAYLRAHKQEPIMVMSLTTCLLIGLLVWVLGSRFGPVGAGLAYLVGVAAVMVPWETAIWWRCRAQWHKV